MHRTPAALEHAIRLLDSPAVLPGHGDMLETAQEVQENSSFLNRLSGWEAGILRVSARACLSHSISCVGLVALWLGQGHRPDQ